MLALTSAKYGKNLISTFGYLANASLVSFSHFLALLNKTEQQQQSAVTKKKDKLFDSRKKKEFFALTLFIV